MAPNPKLMEQLVAETKVCRMCGIEKPVSDFPKRGLNRQGKQRHESSCHQCRMTPYDTQRQNLALARALIVVQVCTDCGQTKPLDDFSKSLKGSLGRVTKCRSCIAARRRAKRAADPQAARANQRAEYRRNPERLRGYSLNRYYSVLRNDPEWMVQASQRTCEWATANPEKKRAQSTRRRALQKGAEGTFTVDDIAEIRKNQRDRCAICRQPLRGLGCLDHIIPLSKGGTNYPNNLQLTHRTCNSSKSNKDSILFMQSLGLLL